MQQEKKGKERKEKYDEPKLIKTKQSHIMKERKKKQINEKQNKNTYAA